MSARVVLPLILGCCFSGASVARAQHLPSPGIEFAQLLEMAGAAAEDGRPERAARLALLARSRVLEIVDATDAASLRRDFADVTATTAQRAREYLAAEERFAAAFGSLGPVPAALDELAAPLAQQVVSFVERRYPETATYVLEPLWVLAPRLALDLHAQIQEISDPNLVDDKLLAVTLRTSELMTRRISSDAIQRIGGIDVPEADRAPIEELRKSTAQGLVETAKKALAADLPWVAVDLAEVTTNLFPFQRRTFDALVEQARGALADDRAAASRGVVTELFKLGKKVLAAKDWSLKTDSVRFPAPRGKPGLLVTKDSIDGDFRFAMELDTDFEHAPAGFAFAVRGSDDYCVAMFLDYGTKPAVKVERYVKGKPERLFWWDAASSPTRGRATGTPRSTYVERHGQTLWLRFGDSPWIRYDANGIDLSGAIGLYHYEKSEGKAPATASRFEFERIPAADGGVGG